MVAPTALKPWLLTCFSPLGPVWPLAKNRSPRGRGTPSCRGVVPVAGARSRHSDPGLASVEQAGSVMPLSLSPYGAKFPRSVGALFFAAAGSFSMGFLMASVASIQLNI